MNRDVGHSVLLGAAQIAPAEIDTPGCGQICRQARHQQIVVSRDRALDAFSGGRAVFPHTQACLLLHAGQTDR